MRHLLFIFLLLIISCKQNLSNLGPSSDLVSKYLTEYVPQNISVKDPIMITLAIPVNTENRKSDIIQINPDVKGTTEWIGNQTISFVPENTLDHGGQYRLTIDLTKVYKDIPKEERYIVLPFSVRELEFSISIDPQVKYEASTAEIKGIIKSSDYVGGSKVEKLMTTDSDLPIVWNHSANGRIHHFTIAEISRRTIEKTVSVIWNGRTMDDAFTGQMSFSIRPEGDFVLTGMDVERQSGAIVLHFSDPVDKSQRLEGLVTINDYQENLRYDIEGSMIRMYPTAKLPEKVEVRVASAIKSREGKSLNQIYEEEIAMVPVKPEVREIGKGVITPNEGSVIFPFEARGLHAVDVEIVKVFSNNILQFLQDNRLNNQPYYLQPVGRIIYQEKVNLSNQETNPDYDQWSRYTLDLQSLVNVDKGALYVVRVGFQGDYTDYPCSNQVKMYPANDPDEEFQTIMRWNSNYEGYSYQHEGDPCYPLYYSENQFIQRNVLASNLGLIAKRDDSNRMHFYVNHLLTLEPVSQAKIDVYDFQKQLIISESVDNNGELSVELSRKPAFAVVNSGDEYGYLTLQDQQSNSLSDFDIGGMKKKGGINGHIFGERGIWRPGDTMFLTFVVEDEANGLPENHPATITVRDSRSQLQYKKTYTTSVGGMYTYKVPTDYNDPTGNWQASVDIGNNTFYKMLKVETVKPNRLKINMELPDEVDLTGDNNILLSSSWLHGAPARNLKSTVDIAYQPARTSFTAFRDYQFTDPARKVNQSMSNVFSGNLDNTGKSNISIKKGEGFLPPGKLNMRIKTRVFEPTGEYSEDNLSVAAHPYPNYVGIKMPETRWGRSYLPREGTDPISFVVVDQQGNPLANKKLNIGLYEAEWQWWYSRSNSNIYRFDAANHVSAKEKTTLTTDANGKVTWRPGQIPAYRYMVRACDENGGHCSGALFFTSYYDDQSNDGGASIVRLSADKTTYQVGEDIKVNVPSNADCKILVSVEGGNQVLSSFWVKGQAEQTTLTIPTDNTMTPNVYVHVSLVQPYDQEENDLPLRMYGVLPVTIEDPQTILKPSIEMVDELRPKESYDISISEADGQEMVYTLAVVDEGLLDLTRFQTPDLHKVFYAKQSLGVKTWDVYDMVLSGVAGQVDKYISIGGDSEVSVDPSAQKTNRFVPVVDFLGPFRLEKGKKNTHRLEMDNYVGSVKVMVVARQKMKYGNAEKRVRVSNPLMVLPTAPRVLSPEETILLPVNVFVSEDNIRNVTVSIETGPGIQVVDNKNTSLRFNSSGEKLTAFMLKADNYEGPSFIHVWASGGGEKIDQKININIENPNPLLKEVKDYTLSAGEKVKIDYSLIGTPGTNKGVVELSTFPAINLENRLDYLIRYPYGCVEQTTSSAFPQLYVDQITEIDPGKRSEINTNITATISRLQQFQRSNGGLSYWKGGDYISEWGTSYAGHFMLEAKEKGHYVPESFFTNWMSFQKDLARAYNNKLDNPRAPVMQAYRLYTLAKSGNPEWGAMNLLRNQEMNDPARYLLAAAYALSAQPSVAEELIKNRLPNILDYQEMSYTYGSSLRDKALIAEAFLSLTDPGKVDVDAMVTDIAKELGKRSWYSTQATAFSLCAISKYLMENPPGDIAATITVNGKKEEAKTDMPFYQLPVDVENISDQSIEVTNEGEGTIYTRLLLSGQAPYEMSSTENNHLVMNVRYIDVVGNPLNVTALDQGTNFIAEVTLTNPGTKALDLEEMALTQVFPSGWEIQNDRISGNTSTIKSDAYEYRDIRDDRVNTFFDLRKKKTFRVALTATYGGRYYLPDIQCQAMYDDEILARIPGQWVNVNVPVTQ